MLTYLKPWRDLVSEYLGCFTEKITCRLHLLFLLGWKQKHNALKYTLQLEFWSWVWRLLSLQMSIVFSRQSKIYWFAILTCFSPFFSPDVCVLCMAARCNLTVAECRAVRLVPCLVFFHQLMKQEQYIFPHLSMPPHTLLSSLSPL